MRTLVALVALSLVTGCVTVESKNAIKTAIAANAGHMKDQSLSQEARDIAQDNYDLWWALNADINGADVPADVASRSAARAATGAQ